MPHVELPSGVRIRYDERGPRDARPVALAHGFGVGLEMWFPQMHVLSQQYRLICWDARGHGGSSAPADIESYTMPALASDLRGLLEALDAVDGAVVGGMSFGGQIVTQYAVDHPRDTYALIVSDSVTRDADQPPRPSRSFEEWAGDPGMEGCMRAMRERPDLTPALKMLDVPTLLIVGMMDDMIMPGFQRVADALPRRRAVMLEACGHGSSGQRPREWNQAVLDFLRDVEAGSPLGEDVIL